MLRQVTTYFVTSHEAYTSRLMTYGPGDDDVPVVIALRQPKFQTVLLHSFRFQVRQDAWIIDILRSSQSSRILSSHFFFGLPLDRCPCVWPWSSIFGNLSFPMRFTCPNMLISGLSTNQRCPFRLTILSVCPFSPSILLGYFTDLSKYWHFKHS